MPFSTHDAYLASVPGESRARLERIQAIVEKAVPDAVRCISYGVPAYRRGRVFFYFAAFKQHIGIYPPAKGDASLMAALAPYSGPKGNLSFPLNAPLPVALIRRVVKALASQYGSR